jgi:hypothetical protein
MSIHTSNSAIISRTRLENHPARITRQEIKQGDIVQRWEPVQVETGGWPPFRSSKTEMRLAGIRRADRNTSDLAGRWSDFDGNLVNSEHDGFEDVPGRSGWEVLILSIPHMEFRLDPIVTLDQIDAMICGETKIEMTEEQVELLRGQSAVRRKFLDAMQRAALACSTKPSSRINLVHAASGAAAWLDAHPDCAAE